ncbi:sensor domain-containing diguanylate cyclase [Marinomonas ostreistagni]|uniref:sensor domain-containing diguanylate cyclase n=1 Tax=Marinomonas ostreistagni TaxID=359209 RepID=UPI0019503F10|nr:sensor domain-containing diguanylate cyclase [Marinomonas ostreistagni]MBM6550374.1 diguanylate cyclase [Marinomonas ostreistagni]
MDENTRSALPVDGAPKIAELILKASRLGTWVWNIQTGAAYFNEEWARIIGYQLSELEPISIDTWLNAVHPEDLAESNAALEAHFRGETDAYNYHVRMQHKDGHWVDIMDQGSLLVRDEHGAPLWAFGVHMDITEQTQQQERLRLMTAVVDTTHQGVMITDADVIIKEVNQAFCSITGFEAEDVIDHKPSILASGRHDQAFYQSMWQQLNSAQHWQGTIWNRHKSGEIYPQLLTIDVLKDVHGHITHYIGAFTDISELMKKQELLLELASRDPLTNLPNRRTFDQELSQRLHQAERQHTGLLLAFMDLDQFKSLNDTYGHYEGDQFLCRVADALALHFDEHGLLCRIGGDEFIGVIDIHHDPIDQAELIQAIKRDISHISQDYPKLKLGISLGLAAYPSDGLRLTQLIDIADERMYADKQKTH